MPLLQTNLEGDYLPQCFRCTSDKPGSLLLLVFSEIQPSLFTPVSSSLPVVMLLCFNSQSALDLKSDWPELLPSSVMRKREELWGRDWPEPLFRGAGQKERGSGDENDKEIDECALDLRTSRRTAPVSARDKSLLWGTRWGRWRKSSQAEIPYRGGRDLVLDDETTLTKKFKNSAEFSDLRSIFEIRFLSIFGSFSCKVMQANPRYLTLFFFGVLAFKTQS